MKSPQTLKCIGIHHHCLWHTLILLITLRWTDRDPDQNKFFAPQWIEGYFDASIERFSSISHFIPVGRRSSCKQLKVFLNALQKNCRDIFQTFCTFRYFVKVSSILLLNIGGLHGTEVTFVPLTQRSPIRFLPSFLRNSRKMNWCFRVNKKHYCLDNGQQRLINVDRTYQVRRACGKQVLKKLLLNIYPCVVDIFAVNGEPPPPGGDAGKLDC